MAPGFSTKEVSLFFTLRPPSNIGLCQGIKILADMKARKKAQNQLVFTGIKLTRCAIFKQCNLFTQQKYNMPAELLIQFAIIRA